VRALLIVVLLLAGCEEEEEPLVPAAPPKAAARPYATRSDVAATAKKRDTCRDSCEQLNIITAGSETELRACRARCDGQFARPPVEPPRSISVAPPRSTAPAVRPR
jgi:hypothetical protein